MSTIDSHWPPDQTNEYSEDYLRECIFPEAQQYITRFSSGSLREAIKACGVDNLDWEIIYSPLLKESDLHADDESIGGADHVYEDTDDIEPPEELDFYLRVTLTLVRMRNQSHNDVVTITNNDNIDVRPEAVAEIINDLSEDIRASLASSLSMYYIGQSSELIRLYNLASPVPYRDPDFEAIVEMVSDDEYEDEDDEELFLDVLDEDPIPLCSKQEFAELERVHRAIVAGNLVNEPRKPEDVGL